MEDILRTELNKQLPYADEVITPKSVICDMINLLWSNIEEAVDPSWSFLDIYCKSAGFLEAIYNMLYYSTDWFEEEHIRKKIEQYKAEHKSGNRSEAEVKYRVDLLNKALESNLHNPENRRKWIFDHMLYGFCITEQIAAICTLELGYFEFNGFTVIKKYKHVTKKRDKEKVEYFSYRNETSKIPLDHIKNLFTAQTGRAEMTIDVVVGNPPYNNDAYLDFIFKARELNTDYVCMITPAKWQSKGGDKNKRFREQIMPYMSKIVYYPNCSDVFEMNDCGGICYYMIDKITHSKKEIVNVCKHNDLLNSTEIRNYDKDDRLLNIGDHICKKLESYSKFSFSSMCNRYCVYINTQVNPARGLENVYQALGMISYSTGKAQILGKYYIIDRINNERPNSNTCKLVFSSNSKEECENFITYAYSKLVRLLIWTSISTTNIVNEETWRFVPDPGPFDHVFTDEELYKKYNITDEEIKIIESVIKERS